MLATAAFAAFSNFDAECLETFDNGRAVFQRLTTEATEKFRELGVLSPDAFITSTPFSIRAGKSGAWSHWAKRDGLSFGKSGRIQFSAGTAMAEAAHFRKGLPDGWQVQLMSSDAVRAWDYVCDAMLAELGEK